MKFSNKTLEEASIRSMHQDVKKDAESAGVSAPAGVELENAACPLCGDATYTNVLTAHDQLTSRGGEFSIVRCNTCGLLRTNPRPTATSISFYYPNEYSPFLKKQTPLPRTTGFRSIASRMIGKLIQYNTAKIPNMQGKRLLEIGCGSGRYLAMMKSLGWSVEGVEPSEFAARAAQQVCDRVYVCSVEDLQLTNITYDLIVGWTVFEHLHQPLVALQKMRSVMHKNSYLVLSMPNAGSWWYRIFGAYNMDWDVPRHLSHFTPKTLEKIAQRAGLRVVKIFHHRVLSNPISSFGFYLDGHVKKRGPLMTRFIRWTSNYATKAGYAHILLYPIACVLAAIGQTGRMTVWLQRDDADQRAIYADALHP